MSSSLSAVTKLFQVMLPKLQLQGSNSSNVMLVIHDPVPCVAVNELLCSVAEIIAQPFCRRRVSLPVEERDETAGCRQQKHYISMHWSARAPHK